MQNTFRAKLGKPEPVWQDELTPKGKKIKVRYLKLSYYCTIAEFPDALQWDGADMYISRHDPELLAQDMVTVKKAEYEALTQGASYLMPNEKREALKTIAAMLLDWCG